MHTGNVTDLSNLAPGERGIVHDLTGGRGFVSRLAALGLTPGGEVTVVQNFGHGPIIVLVRSTRVALGRGEAKKVQVRNLTERGQSK
jgi:ferrous iron transport protein A